MTRAIARGPGKQTSFCGTIQASTWLLEAWLTDGAGNDGRQHAMCKEN